MLITKQGKITLRAGRAKARLLLAALCVSAMKIRVTNQKRIRIRVVLEPWATEYLLDPEDFLDIVSEGLNAESGFFNIEDSEYGVVVYPEGKIDLVNVYDSSGKLLH